MERIRAARRIGQNGTLDRVDSGLQWEKAGYTFMQVKVGRVRAAFSPALSFHFSLEANTFAHWVGNFASLSKSWRRSLSQNFTSSKIELWAPNSLSWTSHCLFNLPLINTFKPVFHLRKSWYIALTSACLHFYLQKTFVYWKETARNTVDTGSHLYLVSPNKLVCSRHIVTFFAASFSIWCSSFKAFFLYKQPLFHCDTVVCLYISLFQEQRTHPLKIFFFFSWLFLFHTAVHWFPIERALPTDTLDYTLLLFLILPLCRTVVDNLCCKKWCFLYHFH